MSNAAALSLSDALAILRRSMTYDPIEAWLPAFEALQPYRRQYLRTAQGIATAKSIAFVIVIAVCLLVLPQAHVFLSVLIAGASPILIHEAARRLFPRLNEWAEADTLSVQFERLVSLREQEQSP